MDRYNVRHSIGRKTKILGSVVRVIALSQTVAFKSAAILRC